MRKKMLPLRRAIWHVRYALANAVMPRKSPSRSVDSAKGPHKDSKADRLRAEELWRAGHIDAALDLLRRKLRENASDSLLWMSYGYRLQALKRYSGAYACFANSVEIDPGNFPALEQFLQMASFRNDCQKIAEVLSRLPEALVGRPERHLDSLCFSVPYEISRAIETVAGGGVATAEAVVDLIRGEPISRGVSEKDSRLALVVFNLCSDHRVEAVTGLRELEAERIPLLPLRLTIRRALADSDRQDASELLKEYLRAQPDDGWARNQIDELDSSPNLSALGADLALLKDGFPLPQPRSTPLVSSNKNGVVYALHNSLPYHSAGYSTRSHGLISTLLQQGWSVDAVTRSGYPLDLQEYRHRRAISTIDYVDAVPYHRLGARSDHVPRSPLINYVRNYADELTAFVRERGAHVVHGASNHLNGLAAVSAARNLGLPSVYEVRGLWEVTRASRDPIWSTGFEYRMIAEMEAEAASAANHVIAITHALKAELIARGVEAEKISVVPNGVDTERFRPLEPDAQLARILDVYDRVVIGYIGSIVDYEGLSLLIEAVAILSQERNDFVVLIVGHGAEHDNLKAQVRSLNLESFFRFTGQVPHDQVERYYSLVDITPFPRLAVPVCEMVSPLKPFEAMAMGKLVIASDVSALTELVDDGVTGIVHRKNDVESLISSLRCAIDDKSLRGKLAEQARSWVNEERRWDVLARRIGRIYESLGAQPAHHQTSGASPGRRR